MAKDWEAEAFGQRHDTLNTERCCRRQITDHTRTSKADGANY